MVKPNWQIAEDMVKRITGGFQPPGSGNKTIKGDVQTKSWILEVKQTDQNSLIMQYNWLTKLNGEGIRACKDVCIVFFFGLRGYPYYLKPGFKNFGTTISSTLSLKEVSLPKEIYTLDGVWELDSWDSLKELKDE